MRFKKVIEDVCHNHSKNSNIQEMLQSIIHTIDHNGENILFYAKDILDINLLINKGANVNIINNNGENVLFQHIREKNNSIIKTFIDHGADYSIQNHVGDNLLSISCRFLNYEMIDYFIQKGIKLNKEQSKSVFYKIAENTGKFSAIFENIYPHIDFSFYHESYKEYKNILLFSLSENNHLYQIRNKYNIFNEDFFIKLIKQNLHITYDNGNNIFLLGARYLNFEDFFKIYELYDFKDYSNNDGENILFVAVNYENIDILSNLASNNKLISNIDKHQKNIHGNNLIQHMKLKGINEKYPKIFELYEK